MIHEEKHIGIDSDIAKIRLEYWITGLNKSVNRLIKSALNAARNVQSLNHRLWVNYH